MCLMDMCYMLVHIFIHFSQCDIFHNVDYGSLFKTLLFIKQTSHINLLEQGSNLMDLFPLVLIHRLSKHYLFHFDIYSSNTMHYKISLTCIRFVHLIDRGMSCPWCER